MYLSLAVFLGTLGAQQLTEPSVYAGLAILKYPIPARLTAATNNRHS
jgi:hypothetical protein